MTPTRDPQGKGKPQEPAEELQSVSQLKISFGETLILHDVLDFNTLSTHLFRKYMCKTYNSLGDLDLAIILLLLQFIDLKKNKSELWSKG